MTKIDYIGFIPFTKDYLKEKFISLSKGMEVIPFKNTNDHNYALGDKFLISEFTDHEEDMPYQIMAKKDGWEGNYLLLEDCLVPARTLESYISRLEYLNTEINITKDIIIYMEKNKVNILNPREYKLHQSLLVLKDKSLSDDDRINLIKKIIEKEI